MPRKTSTEAAICQGETSRVCLRQAEPAGQHRQVEPAEGPERDDLEDRVEGHEHRRGLAVAAGEVVPDDHHGDAAGQADDDQPGAVLGQVVRNSHARANISAGPTTQLSTRLATEHAAGRR